MSENTSIFELITPPDGYAFDTGIWATHDLSVRALTALVLPALAGLGTTDRRGGVSAPAELAPARLLVAAAPDRITPDAFVPASAVTVIPIAGPRQHAKAAVLRYRRTHMREHGPRHLTLVLVTSANLTAGGLTSNREVIYAEWVPSNAHGTSIVRAVIDELAPLGVEAVGAGQEAAWKKGVRDLRAGIPKYIHPSATCRVVSSIGWDFASGVGFPELAFEGVFSSHEVRRVALIGPGFADNNSDVCALLSSVLAPDADVFLVVDTRLRASEIAAGRVVQVPKKLLQGLKDAVPDGAVHVLAAPVDDPSGAHTRVLHGKEIIVETDRGTWHLTGSVNLTRSGLSGRNRELAVMHPGAAGDIDRALSALRACPAGHTKDVEAGDNELPETTNADHAPVFAVFTPTPGQHALRGYLRGDLRVTGVPPNAAIYLADGQQVRLKNGVAAGILIDTANPGITVGSSRRPVLISISPADDAFWSSAPLDTDRVVEDPLLAQLRRDYTTTTTSDSPNGHGSGQHDGFAVPLNRALNAITRYADQIAAWPDERVSQLLDRYFTPGTAEAEVARAVVTAARTGTPRMGTSPTSLLTAAVVAHAGAN